jgi:hypothetical protein
VWAKRYENRRCFIGGSDARIIMGSDETALIPLSQEKRGEDRHGQLDDYACPRLRRMDRVRLAGLTDRRYR